MRNIIYIVFLIVTTIINAQTKERDCDVFYRGGDKYPKPIKYVFFDPKAINSEKKNDKQKIYFHIAGERFVYKKNHKVDTCSIDFLKRMKLDKPDDLQNNEYDYFKKKKKEFEVKEHIKIPNAMPISRIHLYFKVYVLEKTKDNRLLKYEVDWEYSSF